MTHTHDTLSRHTPMTHANKTHPRYTPTTHSHDTLPRHTLCEADTTAYVKKLGVNVVDDLQMSWKKSFQQRDRPTLQRFRQHGVISVRKRTADGLPRLTKHHRTYVLLAQHHWWHEFLQYINHCYYKHLTKYIKTLFISQTHWMFQGYQLEIKNKKDR